MRKYGNPEKLKLFRGEEARVLNEHLAKTGKAVSDFSEEEKDALQTDLEAVAVEDEAEEEVDE